MENLDFAAIAQQAKQAALLEGESLMFSEKLKKINQDGWKQDRILVITNTKILNIKQNEVKRGFTIAKLRGLSYNVTDKKDKEFTLHVKDEYDYRFVSQKREQILHILRTEYASLTKTNLPVYKIDEKNLKGFTTTEKDMKRGIEKFPPIEMRDYANDIIQEDTKKTVSVNPTSAINLDNIDDYEKNKLAAFETVDADDEDYDNQDEVQKSVADSPAQSIYKSRRSVKASLEDFKLIKIVGKGTFGKVFQCLHISTGKIYAMKSIRKDVVLENDSMQSLALEKEILYEIDHPFIVSMDYVFQNQFRIFFLMDFIEGGELFRHLVKVKRFEENKAQFMIAQIAIALGHLHSKQIVYRDLKPENVLFNKDGYLLLADFGLATKVQKGKLATSFCGTAEYLAPEMLKGKGHDFTVDIWTLGILLYEMLVGIPPFFHKNKHQMFYLIQEAQVTYPDPVKHKIYVSPQAQDLINKLLAKKKQNRLGAENGIEDIFKHQFFANLDIDLLKAKKLTPPYQPEIAEGELKFFDPRLTKTPEDEIGFSTVPVAGQKQIQKGQADFNAF